jgi:hypothetical protein
VYGSGDDGGEEGAAAEDEGEPVGLEAMLSQVYLSLLCACRFVGCKGTSSTLVGRPNTIRSASPLSSSPPAHTSSACQGSHLQ